MLSLLADGTEAQGEESVGDGPLGENKTWIRDETSKVPDRSPHITVLYKEPVVGSQGNLICFRER